MQNYSPFVDLPNPESIMAQNTGTEHTLITATTETHRTISCGGVQLVQGKKVEDNETVKVSCLVTPHDRGYRR